MAWGPETAGDDPRASTPGWKALRRAAWEEARSCFETDLAAVESPVALEGLSWATWWMNDADVVLDARERAYRLYREAGEHRGAARMAVWLASDVLDFRGEPAVSAGWLRRAHRLLDGKSLAPEHGWLAVHEGTIALDLEGDTQTARRLGQECAEIGKALGVLDLEMLGIALEGQALVREGEVAAGMRALDEAAAAAVAGELEELVSVGWSCCSLIKACEQVRDHDRASQWSQQTIAFAKRVRFDPWFGICRSFYATVLMWRGMWVEAERELKAAHADMATTRPPWAAEAIVRLGELRICQGRLGDAERLFSQVDFHPRAQLGIATAALTRGDTSAAVALAERVLRNLPASERAGKIPALELVARARVRAKDAAGARAAIEELQPLTAAFGTPALRASASRVTGLVAALEGDRNEARAHLEDAVDLFARSGAPFETACARLDLARALAASGVGDLAKGEARAASEALRDLGASHMAGEAMALIDELCGSHPAAPPSARTVLTRREAEVLRLIATGLSDREMATRLHLSEHTVHRHVSNILAKLAVPSRAAAVAIAADQGLI